MAAPRWWKIVEEFDSRQKAGTETSCPSDNAGKQFCCKRCGAHFDTSVGKAKHDAYGCGAEDRHVAQDVTTMSSCPRCGSFAVDPHTKPVTCQTCESRKGLQ